MQIWCDIFPDPKRPEWYRWRIIIGTVRDRFVVVDERDMVTDYQPTTVTKRDGLYLVSDQPPRPGIVGNIQFLIYRIPFTVEIIGGAGVFKHVIWARGHKIAVKDFGAAWEPTKVTVLLPNPLQARRLLRYALMIRDPVHKEAIATPLHVPAQLKGPSVITEGHRQTPPHTRLSPLPRRR